MFYGQPFLEATKKWLLCFVCMQEITQVEKLCNCFRTSKEKWNKFMPKKYCLKSSKYTQSGWVKKCRDWTLYTPEKLATVFSQSKSLIRSSWCKLESCRNKLIKKERHYSSDPEPYLSHLTSCRLWFVWLNELECGSQLLCLLHCCCIKLIQEEVRHQRAALKDMMEVWSIVFFKK